MGLYPCFQVLYQQSATPYVAMNTGCHCPHWASLEATIALSPFEHQRYSVVNGWYQSLSLAIITIPISVSARYQLVSRYIFIWLFSLGGLLCGQGRWVATGKPQPMAQAPVAIPTVPYWAYLWRSLVQRRLNLAQGGSLSGQGSLYHLSGKPRGVLGGVWRGSSASRSSHITA